MKLFSFNIIINNNVIDESLTPLLYRLENNDSSNAIDICKNDKFLYLIKKHSQDINALRDCSYVSYIYYDTDTDKYNSGIIPLYELLDENDHKTIIETELITAAMHLYKTVFGESYDITQSYFNSISDIYNCIKEKYNVSAETYKQCIISMIKENLVADNEFSNADRMIINEANNIINEYKI